VRIIEPAIDLAVCCSVTSSLQDQVIDNSAVLIGEIGLGGEVRSVSFIEKRIQEAEKLCFKEIIIPKNNFKELKKNSSIEIISAETLAECLQIILGK
jgi:DNA repair protein RadA/Sms